jgi:hypothetical protein
VLKRLERAEAANQPELAANRDAGSEVRMDIRDAQREIRTGTAGGFWGQLLYSVLYFVAAAVGTWVTPKASILTAVIGGFSVFPLMQLMLRLEGRRPISKNNPFYWLCMQIAFVLPLSMLLLWPVGLYRLNWFFPALMILVGAHYLPFATSYGMHMYLVLAGILVAEGYVTAVYFSAAFSFGAWVTGVTLFVFAWIGRFIATSEARREINARADALS